MTITITIETDNAAFIDNPNEAADILNNLRRRIDFLRHSPTDEVIQDTNGNIVGRCVITDTEF